MNTIRNIFQAIKTTLKFLWRHCLTLFIFAMAIDAFLHNHPSPIRVFITILIVMLIDWAKMKIKLGPHSTSQTSDLPLHMKSWNSPSVIGSPFYNLSNPSHNL